MATVDVDKFYLFHADVDKEGNFVGNARPLVRTPLYLARPGAALEAGKPVIGVTDHEGVIKAFNTNEAGTEDIFSTRPFTRAMLPGSGKEPIPLSLPPLEALSYIALAAADDNKNTWAETFVEAMEEFSANHTEATFKKLTQDKLAHPAKGNDLSPTEKAYKTWYEAQKGRTLKGLVLPKVRGIFLVFSLAGFNDLVDTILIKVPGKASPVELKEQDLKPGSNDDFFIATLLGTEKEYPEGLYEFTVIFRQKPGESNAWSGNIIGHKATAKTPTDGVYSYTLSAMARFDYSVPGGEFSLINGDPITLEETLIGQFPSQYTHLIAAAMEYRDKPELPKTAASAAPGEKSYVKNLAMAKSWADTTNKLGSQSSKGVTTAVLGKALHDALSEKYNYDPLKNMLDSTFAWASGVQELVEGKKKLRTAVRTAYALYNNFGQSTGRLIAANFASVGRGSQRTLNDFITNFNIEDYENNFFSRVIPEKMMAFLGKAITIVDVTNSAIAIPKTISSFSTARKNNANAKGYYKEVIDDYMKVVGYKALLKKNLDVEFELDSSVIKDKYQAGIQEALELLTKHDKVGVTIEGHTCYISSDAYNMSLSERRAEAVKQALVEGGIDASRITTVGCGETRPIGDNSTEIGRRKNRRIEAFFHISEDKGAPCREGMQSCESYRMRSVNAQLTSYDKTVALSETVADLALGIATCFPLTAPAALGISFAKSAVAVAKQTMNIVHAVDQSLLSGSLHRAHTERQRLSRLRDESSANQVLTGDLATEGQTLLSKVIPEENLPAVQYRIRAEAINGLLNLITRAAASAADPDSEETLEELLDKYKVAAYIENFILNDQWIYPLRKTSLFTMDEMWLFAVNKYNHTISDKDGKLTEVPELYNGFGFDSAFKLVLGVSYPSIPIGFNVVKAMVQENGGRKALIDATNMMQLANPYMPSDVRADFHSVFPVHHFSSNDVLQLAKNFQVSWPHLGPDIYAFRAIYHREDSTQPWARLTKALARAKPFTPLTQLKVVVIFDPKVVKSIIPVNLQLSRVDGMFNCRGPVYKSIARPIQEKDFDGVSGLDGKVYKEEGCFGCVFHPFFQYGNTTIHGIKPMIPWNWDWDWNIDLSLKEGFNVVGYRDVKSYAEAGNFDEMIYRFNLSIGSDIDGGAKLLYDGPHHEFTVKLDPAREGEASLLVEEFLRSNSIADNTDTLFKGNYKLTPLIRVGGKAWVTADPMFDDIIRSQYKDVMQRQGKILQFHDFDWETKVEFAFVLSINEKNVQTETYKIKGKNPGVFYAAAKLKEDRPFTDLNSLDCDGPVLPKLRFELYGKTGPGDFKEDAFSKADKTHGKELTELDRMMRAGGRQAHRLFGNDNDMYGTYYNYIAYHKMVYTNFNHVKVESIRPFGKGKIDARGRRKDDYYHYYFDRIFSSLGVDTDTDGIQFHFRAPFNFLASYQPWWNVEDLSKKKDSAFKEQTSSDIVGPSYEVAKKWLEDESALLSPIKVEALKGYKPKNNTIP